MAYEIAFYGSAGAFVLPVNPEKMPVKAGGDHTGLKILDVGEAVRPGKRKLRTYQVDGFFPADVADAGVAYFEQVLEDAEAIRMIYSRDNHEPVNVPVVVQNFDYEERGGEPGRIYYKLSLKEARPIQATVIV